MDFSVTSVYINVSMYLYCLSASACISFAKSFWIFFVFFYLSLLVVILSYSILFLGDFFLMKERKGVDSDS